MLDFKFKLKDEVRCGSLESPSYTRLVGINPCTKVFHSITRNHCAMSMKMVIESWSLLMKNCISLYVL